MTPLHRNQLDPLEGIETRCIFRYWLFFIFQDRNQLDPLEGIETTLHVKIILHVLANAIETNLTRLRGLRRYFPTLRDGMPLIETNLTRLRGLRLRKYRNSSFAAVLR